MKKHLSILLFFVALILIQGCNKSGTGTSDGSKVTLQLNLKKGDHFNLVTITKQTIEQKMMGMATTTKQSTEMYMKQEVLDVNDKGEATVKVTYDRIVTVTENSMTGAMKYDSKTDTTNLPQSAMGYSPLIGASFDYTLSKQGKVVSMHGINELIDKVFAASGADVGGEEMKASLKNMFGEESMKSMMQGMNAVYPESQVGVGDTWGSENKLGGGMGLMIKNTFKLESIENDKSVVSFTGEISTDKDSGMELGGISMKYDMTGTADGTMEVDAKSGMVLSSKTTQKMKGSITMMGMTVPMEIDQTVEVKPY